MTVCSRKHHPMHHWQWQQLLCIFPKDQRYKSKIAPLLTRLALLYVYSNSPVARTETGVPPLNQEVIRKLKTMIVTKQLICPYLVGGVTVSAEQQLIPPESSGNSIVYTHKHTHIHVSTLFVCMIMGIKYTPDTIYHWTIASPEVYFSVIRVVLTATS